MSNIFPIDFEEKLTMAQDDYILFSDSEDGNKIKKAQYKNLKGEPGTPGTPGKDGEDGAAATITVGSTTTGAAGSSASVTNSGTSSAAILDFTIPQGAKGEPGEDGDDGAAATITVGTTTTLPAGSSATVTNVGTSQDAILNFGIPKGDSGSGSGDVNGPASSTDGDVAIFDGTTGKLIKDGSVALSTLSSAASLASSAIQPGDDISDLNNDSGFITGITSGDVTTALGYTPANSASLGTASTKDTGTSSGNVPVLDSNGKLATSTLPGVALTDTFTVSTSSDLTSLSSADQGDIAIVTSENKTYVLSVAPYSTASNWKEILAPTGGVTSFNGQTGAVTYTAPVSSVNNQTGAVTVLESQTKVFSMPEVGDNISDLVSWLSAGKSAVLFEGDDTQGDRDGFYYNVIYFYESNGQIECISGDIGDSQVLEYRILYDNLYEVFTKEQNIRLLAPSGGTDGQVLSKVSGNIAWANPSGGDVVVSSDADNVLTTGAGLRAGDEADLPVSPDSNTLYFCF